MRYVIRLLKKDSLSILFLCETWLISGNEYEIHGVIEKGFNFFHKCSPEINKLGRPYGGLGWIVSKELNINEATIEYPSEHVSLLKMDNLWLIGVYLPTGKGLKQFENELILLNAIIREANRPDGLVLMGDFNADLDRSSTKYCSQQDRAFDSWYKEKYKEGLIWLSRLYAQCKPDTFKSGSCIDHVFVNEAVAVNQVNIISLDREQPWDRENNSDHRAIELNMDIKQHGSSVKVAETFIQANASPKKRLRSRINWSNLKERGQFVDTVETLIKQKEIIRLIRTTNEDNKNEVISRALNLINDSILQANDMTIRKHLACKRRTRIRTNNRRDERAPKLKWTDELKDTYEMRTKYNKLWLSTKEYHYRQIYNFYRSKARRLERQIIRSKVDNEAMELTRKMSVNRVQMWKRVGRKLNERVEVDINTKEITDSYTKMFNEKIIKIEAEREKKINDENEEYAKQRPRNNKREVIRLDLIKRIIKSLRNNKSPGDGGISNEMVKYGGAALTIVICLLITYMINYQTVPAPINVGIIFPIIKDNKRSNKDLENTRPITISTTIAIIFEKYMLHKLEENFIDNKVQFGFKSSSSTNHAIFTLKETILHYKTKNKALYLCFLDFSKAFDKVNRKILFMKLRKVMDWSHWVTLYKYYSKSTVMVRNKNTIEDSFSTTVGVKQGGPLSPKLFSFYIDDMIKDIQQETQTCKLFNLDVSALLYADDTTLIYETSHELQRAINIVENFCKENEIAINISKTKVMAVNMGRRIDQSKITLEGQELEWVNKFKYLGWWLEANMVNKEHLKARKLAAILASHKLRVLGFDNPRMSIELKTLLENTYCRSRLNYGLENTYLCARDYKDLITAETRILKKALGLETYHSNTLLYGALEITPIDISIKLRKLKFVEHLMKNGLTKEIIINQLSTEKRSNKSVVTEIMTILNRRMISEEELSNLIKNKIRETEEESRKINELDITQTIRYMLKNRNQTNDEVARRLLQWENAQDAKRMRMEKVNKAATRHRARKVG